MLLSFVSLLLCLLVYSEKRYYDNYIFFELDLQSKLRMYIYLYIFLQLPMF